MRMHRAPSARIAAGDPEFLRAASQLAHAFSTRQVTVFTGAGVSQPSGLPGSRPLVETLVDAMADSLSQIGLGEASERAAVQDVLARYPLERLLDAVVGTHGDEVVLEYLRVLEGAPPNYNHEAVALLAARGWLPHVVTLNFDVLFEEALRRRSVPFAWHLPLAAEEQIPDSAAPQVVIVKPHGTLPFEGLPFAPHYLAATLRHAGDRPQRVTADLLRILAVQSPILLVAGYSDNDWDIFPLLAAAPWSRVLWCQFVPPSNLNAKRAAESPCDRVEQWLAARPAESTLVLFGDVRALFAAVLDDGDVSSAWQDEAERMPDASLFSASPARTSLAAIRLLDGTDSDLYRHLLPEFGNIGALETDLRLRRQWQRSMSWFHHAHRRDVRSAVKLHYQLLDTRSGTGESALEYLWDLKTLYYEHISAAKRPYLNLFFTIDLLRAGRVASTLRKAAAQLIADSTASPWMRREADRQVAYLTYYKLDLLHNWVYHLLPFANAPLRALTRKLFSNIALRYRRTAEEFPVFDWEYHYVRSVEAALIAGETPLPVVREKLTEIGQMFERTGSFGHLAYLRGIEAIIERSELAFRKVEETFFDERTGTTPSGKLRMRLLRRYFWPRSISLHRVLLDLVRYSRVQE